MYAALQSLLYLWEFEEQSGRGSKFKRRNVKIKEENCGKKNVVVDPSAILSELPISTSFSLIKVL